MRSLLALCLVAACYAPNTPAGRPCTTEIDNCPDGQSCRDNVCVLPGSAPPDAPPAADADVVDGDAGDPAAPDGDGDGKADALDNCPAVANADQADEDGDMIGDGCDGCANLADAPLVDGDADGIGNACDPNPTMDVRWLFEGFHSMDLPPWGKSPGWSAGNDGLSAMAAGNSDSDGEYLTLPLFKSGRSFDKLSITMTVVIGATQGNDGLHDVGTVFFDENLDRSLYCELQQLGTDNTNRGLAVEEWNEGNPPSQRDRQTMPYVWKFGSEYRLTFVRQGRSYTCTVVGPEGTRTITVLKDVVPNLEPELGAFGANVQVRSVLVVGPPP